MLTSKDMSVAFIIELWRLWSNLTSFGIFFGYEG